MGGRGEGGVEFGVADCDEALEAVGGADRPLGGRTGGGGFEVGGYGFQGGVIVACDNVSVTGLVGGKGRGGRYL